MADLSGVLAKIPGLAGYLGKKQLNDAEDQQARAAQMGELQMATTLQGVLAKVRAEQEEKAYRSEMAAAKTPEEQYAVAVKRGGPAAVMQSMDRRTTADQTKQIAMSRLAQTIQKDAAEIAHKARTATTAEEKFHWQQQMDVLKASAQKQAAEIAAGRYTYDTGMSVAPFQGAVPQAPAAAAPQGAMPVGHPTPEERAAMRQLRPLAQGGGSVEVQPGMGAAPVAAPQMAPQPMSQPAAPNNLDARDLGAMARGPVMGSTPVSALAQAQPTATPSAPAAPVMPQFSGSPRERAAAENRWKLEQGKTSIAGAGKLTPEALTDIAAQYLAGDRQAISGFARDQATKSAIQNEISKQMRAKGWTGPDVAAQMADFAGIMSGSRTVGTRAAQIELASSEADKMIDIARERSKAFERTQFVPVNVAIKAFETNTGQPEVKAFGAAINSLVNVYARAISPSGVPTVSDKDHAREMLASVDSVAQFKAVTDVMRQEMKAAREAPLEVRRATRAAVTGNTSSTGEDKFTVGRIYTDAQQNKAKYLGNGKWETVQ